MNIFKLLFFSFLTSYLILFSHTPNVQLSAQLKFWALVWKYWTGARVWKCFSQPELSGKCLWYPDCRIRCHCPRSWRENLIKSGVSSSALPLAYWVFSYQRSPRTLIFWLSWGPSPASRNSALMLVSRVTCHEDNVSSHCSLFTRIGHYLCIRYLLRPCHCLWTLTEAGLAVSSLYMSGADLSVTMATETRDKTWLWIWYTIYNI